ncbi:fibronectin type III domain-containing protein, partial [Flammeovirga sp. EKP202]|uniref:fibronectin type III domain-containing protein n=1 Tax=Flammeovirga sp. EKP202 TaxID=2770592 RepID=UPI00165F0957
MFQLYNYKLSTLAGWKLITFLSIFSSIFIAEHSFALSPQVVTSNESTLNQFKNNVFIELGTNTHEIDITALNDEYHTVMITSDDEDLVTATIQGNQLILTPQNDKVGATQIRINVNNSITASFTVFINSTIDRLMYQEGFERNNGQWFSMGNNSSWEWGTPNSTIINKAANGSDKAWKTNLDGNYNPQEQSYLISPLFDLSAVEKVKISFDLWWELTESIFVDPRDGVRLEYSTDLGESWHSLTNEGRSQNWYNEGNIPSFNGAGWAYEEGNEDYFPAFLESEKLGGESQVMFRFFLHSISHNPTEGFAFDNFSLQEVDYDLGIETVNVVHNNVQVGVPFSAEVTVKNYGTKALNNFNVSHQYNGAGEITITASNTMLAPNAETTITIDNLVFDRGGQQAIQFFVDQANDVFTINDEFNLEILPQSATDLKINSIEKPIVIAESVPFEVEVENIGSNALGAFSISYQLGEQPRGSVNFDQGVLAGATATVMVTGIVGEENGTFPLELRLSNDGDNSNNSITEDFTISPILSGLPYNENLENNDGSWVAGGFRSSWEYVNGNGGKVWKSDIESHYLNRKEVSYIVSPVFDFTDIAKMRLSMDIEYNIQNGRGGALMEYSTDLGKTWHLLGLGWYNHHRYDLNQYRPILHRDHWWAGNSNGFQRHTVENDQIGNQQHVVFRYRVEAQDSNQFSRDHEGFSFDNVTILSANHNLALTNILTDFAPANGNFELKVEVKNEGGKTQDNFKIAYQIDGGEVVEKNITTSITPNRSSIITLDDVEALTVGEHTVDVEIVLDKDFDKSNNTFSKDIQVLPIVSQFPYNEDFENDNGDWFAYGTNNSWEWGVATDQKQGNVWATNLDGHYNQEEKSYIVSPFFDISDLSNIDISFDSWWNITFERDYINARNDNVVFQYSIDQGVTWVDFHPNEESENWHNKVYHSHGPFFFGTVSYWSGSSLDESNSNDFVRSVSNLSTTNHFKKVVFRFSFNSFDHLNTAEGFSFDNVRIMEKINPPTNLVLSNTSTTQLTFNWDKVQNATSYEYELSTDRDHFEANISNRGMVMNAETVQISKLSPSTKYYFRVKAVNKLLESEFTNIIEGTTATNTTLEVPLNIVVSNTTTSQLTFTWEKVQDATSYEYELSTDRNDFNNNILTNGSISSGETIQFDNLSPASTYFFRVKAKNATTESAFSDIVEGTTTAIPTLDIPANLVVSNPTTTQLTFTWEKVQDATSYEYALSTDR